MYSNFFTPGHIMYVTKMIILIKKIIMQVFVCDPEFCPGSEYTLVVQLEANPLPTQVVSMINMVMIKMLIMNMANGRDEHSHMNMVMMNMVVMIMNMMISNGVSTRRFM